MYFITPSKSGIFLIGVCGNRLYGFGEKNKKLCIYRKSIFDSGDWEEYLIIDTNVMNSECCDTGLHVAASIMNAECCDTGLHVDAGIFPSSILVVAKDIEFAHVFSIDIITKQIKTYKIIKKDLRDGTEDMNLCCKCLMPTIRFDLNTLPNYICFLITPRRFKRDTEICQYGLVKTSFNYYGILNTNVVSLDHDPSSSITFNFNDKTLSVNERSEENGKIKTLLFKSSRNHRIINIPDSDSNFLWHDMTFLSGDHGNIFALTRRQNTDNNTLRIFKITFTDNDNIRFSEFSFSLSVDLDFPSFESSPFLFAYDYVDPPGKFRIKKNFFLFESSAGIVTIPLRMLSLSESAYLSLRQIPEPLLSPEIQCSSSKKKVTDPWMSLNFIKKTMGLPDNFDLK